MAHSDRIRRQQIIREAEGYLELVMLFADEWPLPPPIRDCVAQRAIGALDRLKNADGERCNVLYLRGQALRVLERFDLAIAPLSQAAAIEPENVSVHLALGWCHKRLGRLDLAIESLQAAQAADPDQAIIYYNLACYWSLAKHKRRAIECLSRALSMDPNYRDLIEHESDFDALRSDPDFQALTTVIV